MSTAVALKSNFGPEFDMSTGLIHLTVGKYLKYQAGTFIPEVDIALLAADLNAALTNQLTLTGTQLASIVNGIQAVVDLTSAVKAAETVTTMGWDPVTSNLTYTNEAGVLQTADLSQFLVDIYANATSFDPTSFIFTLTRNDGTTFTVNLADLKIVVTVNTNTIKFGGDGTALTPLTANVVFDPSADNMATATTGGVMVSKTAVQAAAVQAATLELVDINGVHVAWVYP